MPDLDLGRGRGPAVDFDDDEDTGTTPALEMAPVPGRGPRVVPQASASPAQRPAAPADVRGSGGGAMFDDDDDMLGGDALPLELDMPQSPPKAQRMASAIAPSGPPAPRASYGPSKAHFEAGPTGGSVRPVRDAESPMQSIEARLLGNFGEAPTKWWQAPVYAWKVRNRLAELRQALALRRKDAERASAQTQAALVALGQRARATAEQAPSYGRTLEVLKSAEALLRSRDGALMADMDVHTKKMAVLDQRTQKLEAELASALAAERKIAGELAEVQATAQRAEAKVKRLDIELRGSGTGTGGRRGGA